MNIQELLSIPDQCQVVAVTKKRSIDEITALLDQGIQHLAENRLQELEEKYSQAFLKDLKKRGIKLHFIGHLQTNKVNKVIRFCEVIQSVDSLKLAEKINTAAESAQKTISIFLQLNISGETQKSGLADDEQLSFIVNAIRELQHLDLKGFMAMGVHGDLKKTRQVFRRCRELASLYQLQEVSMGMSEDYQVAIEEGATMLRLGRILFENLGNQPSQ